MAIEIYLAMSAAQLRQDRVIPERAAWMACHFSPGSDALSNCPRWLPPGSLLMLDDSLPMDGHDPQLILAQLEGLIRRFSCRGLLLDLQRPPCPETEALVRLLRDGLSCTVAVSARYADCSSGPVLLPPVPPYRSPEGHLGPWAGRELWLELALEGAQILLTPSGASIMEWVPEGTGRHRHKTLHCSYDTEVLPGQALFTLRRSREDTLAMLDSCQVLGVTAAIGLYQEFG